MELSVGLQCRRLEFRWPGEDPATGVVLASAEAAFPPGTINLVTGETGAGKSTLLHLLAGLLHPTAGEVWADGEPVSRWPSPHRDHWRRRVGIVFQHLALIPDLSAAENLLLPLIPRDMAWSRMQHAVRRQLVAAGLSSLAGTPAYALSGGQRQRLAIARALIGHPRFILADEPTAFQDDGQTTRMVGQLADAARGGAVVVICSHDPRLRLSQQVDRQFHLAGGTLTAKAIQQESP